jgi:L-cysteate sulfo-lyase
VDGDRRHTPDPTFVAGPTQVDRADRLAAAIGLDAGDLLVKRDDLIGLGGGGNKARKLQITMGEALRSGAEWVLTTGAPQSNHARLTAAAAARVGLRCALVLQGDEPDTRRGNVLLDQLFGAHLVWSGDATAESVADSLEAEGRLGPVSRIPFGGSNAASATAYVDAARELREQVPDVRHVVVAIGSGGTMAGLVAELGAEVVLGVDCGAVPDGRATVAGLLADMGHGDRSPAEALRVDRTQIGAGYEHLTDGTRAAMSLAAEQEGLLLDPTYTGRAFSGLVDAVARGDIQRGERTVFQHTGGLPGLFGHPAFSGADASPSA